MLAGLVMAWFFLVGLVVVGLVGPNRLAVEREFGFSHAQFGAAFAVIQIVCAVVAVGVIPRWKGLGNGAAFGGALLTQTVGFALLGLSRSVWGLGAGWTLITLGTVLGMVANTLSARLWPDNPRRGVTWLHGWNGLGKVAGPLLAALCLTVGWRLSFLLVGVLTALLLAGYGVRGRQFAALFPARAADTRRDAALLRRPDYWLCILPFGLIAGGDVCFAALVPTFYAEVRGWTARTAALLLGAHLLGVAVGRFAFVALDARLSGRAVIALCLLCGLGVVPAVLARTLAVQGIALFFVGVMFSSTWPAFYAQVSPRFPSDASHLLDYGSALGNALGIALLVWLSSVAADVSPAAGLWVGPGALWLFGLLFFLSPLSQEAA